MKIIDDPRQTRASKGVEAHSGSRANLLTPSRRSAGNGAVHFFLDILLEEPYI